MSVSRKRRHSDANSETISFLEKINDGLGIQKDIFHHRTIDFNAEGLCTFYLVDEADSVAKISDVALKKYEDLTLTSFYLPSDSLDHSQNDKEFWNLAHAAEEAPRKNSEIFISFIPSVKTELWFPQSKHPKGYNKLDRIYKINCPVKYHISKSNYDKYVKNVNIENPLTKDFYKKRLFDVNSCLKDNGNTLPLVDEFSEFEKSRQPNTIYLHYDFNTKSFDYLRGKLHPNLGPNYMSHALKRTYDFFMIVGKQLIRINFFDYLWKSSSNPIAYNIGNDSLSKMNEYTFISAILNKDPPPALFTNKDVSATHPISIKNHVVSFKKATFYTTIEGGDVFKASEGYLTNKNAFKITKRSAYEIAYSNNILDQVGLLLQNDTFRELYEITILSDFNWLLNASGDNLNGFTVHFPYCETTMKQYSLQKQGNIFPFNDQNSVNNLFSCPDQPGLKYKYYEPGYLKVIPDFSKLTPKKTGSVPTTVNAFKKIGVQENEFALEFMGKIEIVKVGQYKFRVGSDDGSKLYINNKEIIDNNGSHNYRLVYSKPILLDSGKHDIKIEFFEAYGSESLDVHYSGKDTNSNYISIPDKYLTHEMGAYTFKFSNVVDSSISKPNSASKSLSTDYNDGELSDDEFTLNFNLPIKKNEFLFYIFNHFVEHSGKKIDRNNSSASYIAYCLDGTQTNIPEYDTVTHILDIFNVSKKDIKFSVKEQGYARGINIQHPPNIYSLNESFHKKIEIYIRSFTGSPYNGIFAKGYFPARNCTFVKIYHKKNKIINMVRNNFTVTARESLLLTVPDGSLQEYVTLTSDKIKELEMPYKKGGNNILVLYLKTLSFPTLMKNKECLKMFIACKNFNKATPTYIFDDVQKNGTKTGKVLHTLGSVNLGEIKDWNELKMHDDRFTLTLHSNDGSKLTDYFKIDNLFELQNLKLFLVDDEGKKILFSETSTTKRPQFQLMIEVIEPL